MDDAKLIEELEEKLEGLQDADSRQLNGFEDADLAMYPAIEIPEINLTIVQCETIANNLIRLMLNSENDETSMLMVARAMAVLAYNTLMDIHQSYASSRQMPLFHRFNKSVYNEKWLRTTGVTAVDIEELSKKPLQESDGTSDAEKLELVSVLADENERKTSIGVWAFCHLRALRPNARRNLRSFFERVVVYPNNKMMEASYGFRSAYKFPLPSHHVFNFFRNQCVYQKPGELMYLFYRGAIILEGIFQNPKLLRQKRLLMGLAYGGREDGLLYGGLTLWTQSVFAVKALDIPHHQLFDDLAWALKDERWVKYSASSLKVVEMLKQFYIKYEGLIRRRNRYHIYARVVNHYYFYWLSSRSNLELSHALRLLYLSPSEAANSMDNQQAGDSVYLRWGELLAAKIQEKYRHPTRMFR